MQVYGRKSHPGQQPTFSRNNVGISSRQYYGEAAFWLCTLCCGAAFPRDLRCLLGSQWFFCRFLSCHSARRVLMKGYHSLLIQAKGNSRKRNGSCLVMSTCLLTCPICMWTGIHFTTGVKTSGRSAGKGVTNRSSWYWLNFPWKKSAFPPAHCLMLT